LHYRVSLVAAALLLLAVSTSMVVDRPQDDPDILDWYLIAIPVVGAACVLLVMAMRRRSPVLRGLYATFTFGSFSVASFAAAMLMVADALKADPVPHSVFAAGMGALGVLWFVLAHHQRIEPTAAGVLVHEGPFKRIAIRRDAVTEVRIGFYQENTWLLWVDGIGAAPVSADGNKGEPLGFTLRSWLGKRSYKRIVAEFRVLGEWLDCPVVVDPDLAAMLGDGPDGAMNEQEESQESGGSR
jgi:hypothetical protein